jgi:cytochrome b6-f complex iron-sulfur subunit
MSATAILATTLVAVGVVVIAAVFAVAWRRGPAAAPIVGEFDREAARRDVSAAAPQPTDAPAAETEEANDAGPGPEPAHEPPEIADERIPITAADMGVTRRKFLNRAVLGLFGGAFFVSLGGGMLTFLWPKLKGGFGSKITADKLDSLRPQLTAPDGSIVPLFIPEAQTWLIPFPESELTGSSFEGLPVLAGATADEPGVMALWQRCVHLGCRVPACESSQGFECPCHGSRYNFHGEYEAGPAPRNLDRFAVEVNDNGNLVIDTGSVIQTPRAHHKTIAYPQGPSCL